MNRKKLNESQVAFYLALLRLTKERVSTLGNFLMTHNLERHNRSLIISKESYEFNIELEKALTDALKAVGVYV